MVTPVQGVIFDLDGTLLDSLTDIAHAANAVLRKHGFPTHEVQAYRYFVGDGVRRLMHRTLPRQYHDDESLFMPLVTEFVDRYHRTWNVESRLYDGIPEMLDALVERNVSMAVLSNKPQAATSQCVDYFLSQYAFAAVLGQTEDRPPKPDLTGVLQALQLLGVPPHACLYLGDTGVDMQTARGANLIAVGASWGFRDRDELQRGGAQLIIDHPWQLIDILEQRQAGSA